MSKLLEGLFWGVGFAIGTLSIVIIYTFTIHTELENSLQKSLQDTLYYELSTFIETMDIQVLEIKLVDESLIISSKMKNLGDTPPNSGFSLRYSLFDSNNEFIGNCEGDFPKVHSSEDFLYLTTICDTKYLSTLEVNKATISVLREY
ncbi:hypothetical protein [Glaciecola sp. 1036]|uniref:hypothetical protein n=1 Tax=Alteromonadaceae TaxID=72275 RepID=UPI003D0361EF